MRVLSRNFSLRKFKDSAQIALCGNSTNSGPVLFSSRPIIFIFDDVKPPRSTASLAHEEIHSADKEALDDPNYDSTQHGAYEELRAYFVGRIVRLAIGEQPTKVDTHVYNLMRRFGMAKPPREFSNHCVPNSLVKEMVRLGII